MKTTIKSREILILSSVIISLGLIMFATYKVGEASGERKYPKVEDIINVQPATELMEEEPREYYISTSKAVYFIDWKGRILLVEQY